MRDGLPSTCRFTVAAPDSAEILLHESRACQYLPLLLVWNCAVTTVLGTRPIIGRSQRSSRKKDKRLSL